MMKFRRQTRFFRFGLRCSLLNSCLLLLFSKIKLLLLLTLSDPYMAEQRRAGRPDLPAILNGQVIDKGIRIAGIVRKHIPVARQYQFRLQFSSRIRCLSRISATAGVTIRRICSRNRAASS